MTHWQGTIPAPRADWLKFCGAICLRFGNETLSQEPTRTIVPGPGRTRPSGAFVHVLGIFHVLLGTNNPAMGEWCPMRTVQHNHGTFPVDAQGHLKIEWVGTYTGEEMARAETRRAVFWYQGVGYDLAPVRVALLPPKLYGLFDVQSTTSGFPPPLQVAQVDARSWTTAGSWDFAVRIHTEYALVFWGGGVGLPCESAERSAYLRELPENFTLDGRRYEDASRKPVFVGPDGGWAIFRVNAASAEQARAACMERLRNHWVTALHQHCPQYLILQPSEWPKGNKLVLTDLKAAATSGGGSGTAPALGVVLVDATEERGSDALYIIGAVVLTLGILLLMLGRFLPAKETKGAIRHAGLPLVPCQSTPYLSLWW